MRRFWSSQVVKSRPHFGSAAEISLGLITGNRVFIGLESINPANLKAANKRQNEIAKYREMLQQWIRLGVTTYAGFIHGFEHDTRESILQDIETIKRELPVAALEFSFLTPLPGSADHKQFVAARTWMDPDLNKYDLSHRVTHHPRMSDEEWTDIHWEAWRSFYNHSHVQTIMRRNAAMRGVWSASQPAASAARPAEPCVPRTSRPA